MYKIPIGYIKWKLNFSSLFSCNYFIFSIKNPVFWDGSCCNSQLGKKMKCPILDLFYLFILSHRATVRVINFVILFATKIKFNLTIKLLQLRYTFTVTSRSSSFSTYIALPFWSTSTYIIFTFIVPYNPDFDALRPLATSRRQA